MFHKLSSSFVSSGSSESISESSSMGLFNLYDLSGPEAIAPSFGMISISEPDI